MQCNLVHFVVKRTNLGYILITITCFVRPWRVGMEVASKIMIWRCRWQISDETRSAVFNPCPQQLKQFIETMDRFPSRPSMKPDTFDSRRATVFCTEFSHFGQISAIPGSISLYCSSQECMNYEGVNSVRDRGKWHDNACTWKFGNVLTGPSPPPSLSISPCKECLLTNIYNIH